MTFVRTALCVALAAAFLFAADDEDAKRLPDGDGKDTVGRVCLSCHGSGSFRKLRLTQDAWSEKVADMIDRGAQVSDAQSTVIVGYLAKTFGKGAPIQVNSAPFEELRSVLGLTAAEAQALLAARKEKGPFHSLEELENVPGIDAKKVESKKELIAF